MNGQRFFYQKRRNRNTMQCECIVRADTLLSVFNFIIRAPVFTRYVNHSKIPNKTNKTKDLRNKDKS